MLAQQAYCCTTVLLSAVVVLCCRCRRGWRCSLSLSLSTLHVSCSTATTLSSQREGAKRFHFARSLETTAASGKRAATAAAAGALLWAEQSISGRRWRFVRPLQFSSVQWRLARALIVLPWQPQKGRRGWRGRANFEQSLSSLVNSKSLASCLLSDRGRRKTGACRLRSGAFKWRARAVSHCH